MCFNMIKGVTCLAWKLEGLLLQSARGPRSHRNLHVRTKQNSNKVQMNSKNYQTSINRRVHNLDEDRSLNRSSRSSNGGGRWRGRRAVARCSLRWLFGGEEKESWGETKGEQMGSLVLYMKRTEENWATRWSDGICGGVAWAHGRQVKEEIGAGRGGDKRGKRVLQKWHYLIRYNST